MLKFKVLHFKWMLQYISYSLVKVYKKENIQEKRENVAETLKNYSIKYHLLMKLC